MLEAVLVTRQLAANLDSRKTWTRGGQGTLGLRCANPVRLDEHRFRCPTLVKSAVLQRSVRTPLADDLHDVEREHVTYQEGKQACHRPEFGRSRPLFTNRPRTALVVRQPAKEASASDDTEVDAVAGDLGDVDRKHGSHEVPSP